MAGKIDRRTVIVDGREMVAVRPADFERLDASRRQMGARSSRITRLQQQLKDANARLARIEEIMTAAGPDDCRCEQVSVVVSGGPIKGRATAAPSTTTSSRRRRR
ncbi:hypothetical protein [Actinoplanes sp. NBRC 103695]|uniref:hypothetical protein n=1 Tax=Actinoplanes sp. NBRC 103695 TaxID=3032202 RepID=UPI0024A02FBB|nr:hypothetical protein [Actinoplanes sp. NBRC 103695]GLZ01608.1 hypothetical protein Acsp02_88590 [Actinoplanes sp. NBRC 103695]